MCRTSKSINNKRGAGATPFLLKTYMLVDDAATDDVVSWNKEGSSLVVWEPVEFARDILPKLFKHSNFPSFVRQLNTYGFRKVTTSRWEFCNDMFQKDKKELLGQIHRRKAWTNRQKPLTTPTIDQTNSKAPQAHDEDQRSTSTSSAHETRILIEENNRLKQQNETLGSELRTMRKKCNDLLELVTICAEEVENGQDNDNNDDDDIKKQPMLFGVRLQVHEGRDVKTRRPTQAFQTTRLLLSQSWNY